MGKRTFFVYRKLNKSNSYRGKQKIDPAIFGHVLNNNSSTIFQLNKQIII